MIVVSPTGTAVVDAADEANGAEERAPSPPHGIKRRCGFAAMDPDRVREIAAAGGRTAHARGKAHRWTTDEAKAAGRKGGEAARTKRGNGT